LKKDLFQALGIEETTQQFSEEEIEQKRRRFEAFLESRKK
jgi:hypothetical protein